MPLADTACRNAKPDKSLKKLSDGGGLQLWIQPSGSKLWRLAYRFEGKQKLLAIGPYPLVSLSDARRARDDAKRLLLNRQDPSEAKRATRVAQRSGPTFQEVAGEYVAKLERENRSEQTISKLKWLLSLAEADLGERELTGIKAADVFPVLQAIELSGRRESARRLRSTLGAVFRFAIATGRTELDPTIALKGALAAPIVKSRAAVTDPSQLGGLLRAIDGFDGQPTTHAALKLMPILFPRPGELRAAAWDEFDLELGEWIIPASRAKMRRPHRVPLPLQALTICYSSTGNPRSRSKTFGESRS
ncbi:integrase arm-type DNA-binding domain-containing protein [Ancylobacter sp. GSK1Z-4-2]|nr:integrase arm-type DNA-binding domain-containing protein [Ancylobacter mangrovi]MCS0503380.1 integrase arm-type DNA-binding domain-containing protein [Ancylobacter mangrovi]